MESPSKRVVVVRLTSRQKSDPEGIIPAIREPLRQKGVELRVLEQGAKEEEPRLALEQLEAAAINLATVTLDEKARQLATQATDSVTSASPGRIVLIGTKLKVFARSLFDAGYKIAIEEGIKRIFMG